MQKTLFTFVLMAFIVMAGIVPVIAQTPTPSTVLSENAIPVRIVKGNAPWRFAGSEWRIITELNPDLKKKVVEYSADDIRVTWEAGKVYLIPIRFLDELQAQNPGAAEVVPNPYAVNRAGSEVVVPPPAPAKNGFGSLWFLLLPLIAALLLSAYVWGLPWWNERKWQQQLEGERQERVRQQAEADAEQRRQLALDPITSGTPYVPGGIEPTDTVRLEAFFDSQALEGYLRGNPGTDRATVRVERVGPVESGTLSGEGLAGYLDNPNPQPRRFDPPQPGYQARYRMPDGTERVLQSLQRCMNPVTRGEFLAGFTFTPTGVAVPAPVPPAVPTPMRPTIAATATANRSSMVAGNRRFSFPEGAIILVGADGAVSIQLHDGAAITVEPLAKAAAKPRRKAAGGAAS